MLFLFENKEDISIFSLQEFAANLKDTGVHGGVIALEKDFHVDTLALHLKLPNNHPVSSLHYQIIISIFENKEDRAKIKSIFQKRRVLLDEFIKLLQTGTTRSVDEYYHGSYRSSYRRRAKSGSNEPSPRKIANASSDSINGKKSVG